MTRARSPAASSSSFGQAVCWRPSKPVLLHHASLCTALGPFWEWACLGAAGSTPSHAGNAVCANTALWPCRRDFHEALKERHFAFSVLVHADNTSPLIDFLASSSVLQVSKCAGLCCLGLSNTIQPCLRRCNEVGMSSCLLNDRTCCQSNQLSALRKVVKAFTGKGQIPLPESLGSGFWLGTRTKTRQGMVKQVAVYLDLVTCLLHTGRPSSAITALSAHSWEPHY